MSAGTQADASRVNLAYVAESTFGVTPSGPPTLADIRHTGETLRQDTSTTTSNEIRADRQIPDRPRTSISASGDINFELFYGDPLHDLFRYALWSADWTTAVTVASGDTGVSAAASDNSFNHTGSWDNNPAPGDWIQVSGFTGASTTGNGVFRVISVTSSKIIVEGEVALIDDSAGEAVTITAGAHISAGTTCTSLAIERQYGDLTNEFAIFNGMVINTLNMSVAAEAILTGSFGFLGKSEASATSTAGDGSNTAAATGDVLNAVDNVTALLEGGGAHDITGFSMALNNNARTRIQVGSAGAISVGAGNIDLTGTLTAYYESSTEIDKYLAYTASRLGLITTDADSNIFIIEIPRVKYSAGSRNASGPNTDVIAELSWGAMLDSATSQTLQMFRFPAA